MSILRVNKDHLKEHGGVQPVAAQSLEAPQTGDALVFWTKHPKEPVQVNLHEFASGKSKGSGGKFVPFSGRPELLTQILPALQEQITYAARRSVSQFFTALRNWWRVLDSVELAAAKAGQVIERVEDVRLMTNVHAEAAYRRHMSRTNFGKIRSLVDVTRLALGARATHWEIPEDDPAEKHLPPEDQRRSLRVAVKRECRKVLEHWAACEELQVLDTPPEDPERRKLWACVRHMQAIQKKTGKVLPSTQELNNGSTYKQWTHQHLEAGLRFIRATAFPDCRDALAVWTQCLINTPWNPSTLLSLDVSERFLFDHFKDDPADPHRRWVLVGQKERSGGKDQFVFGMWKTLDGPGYLIKTYLARVEPLRDILKAELASAQARYLQLRRKANSDGKVIGDQAEPEEAGKLFARIASLKQGCRSVWLFVNQKGEINWLQEHHSHYAGYVNGETASYLDEIRRDLNLQRVAHGEKPVPKVSPKDFRVWFADYVYRSSQGSILAVRSALGHSSLGTSVRYVNTNVRNQEASDSARKFLDILVDELDHGRIDLTILAHLYRHGKLTPEQEKRLADLRTLPKSREGVACKDAHHPPAHLRATPGEACDVQRCLLCVEHAVILPESLDGIAMREAELRAMQNFLPATSWVEEKYDIELENHMLALRRFDLNHVIAARRKWTQLIARGEHLIPGVPSDQIAESTEPT